jgi:16S rRNA (adenine1518-N6/adenine1519-N6)-dimethyltransferase
VLAQFSCEADVALRIPPAAFTPPPSVTSAIVVLRPRASLPPPALFKAMERLTAAAFGQRRKMLRGALRGLGGEALLAAAGINGERRAETLSVDELARLAAALLGPADALDGSA